MVVCRRLLFIGAAAVAALQLDPDPDVLFEAGSSDENEANPSEEKAKEKDEAKPVLESERFLFTAEEKGEIDATAKDKTKDKDKGKESAGHKDTHKKTKNHAEKGGEESDVDKKAENLLEGLEKTKVGCQDLPNVPKNVKAMFINLDSRTDRLQQFKSKVPAVLEPYKRCLGWSLERFSAIKADAKGKHNGQVAAARSHVGVLKKSLEDPDAPLLVFEDDFRFSGDAPTIAKRIEDAFKAGNGSWDVMMMGDNSYDTESMPDARLQKAGIKHTTGAWCSEAYMVAPKYKATLLETVQKGLKKMEGGAEQVNEEVEPLGAAYDTLWYPLQHQKGSRWFVFRPKIGEQENTWGDSNILGD